MKKILIGFVIITNGLFANCQVPKKIIVEHFTNSKCGNCASRNPGFYTNLQSQTDILHLAMHPSSPYASCAFSMHNPSQNDNRTNFYGIYGGTPRLVIQGTIISGAANYSSAAIFTNYLSQTTPWQINIVQTKYASDSVVSNITIKKVSASPITTAKLFVALAEDTVFYAAPNGEQQHYDVFRKSITDVTGNVISLPITVGDSTSYSFASNNNTTWDFNRIYTLAILQDSATKEVMQAEAADAKQVVINPTPTNIANNKIELPYHAIYTKNLISIEGIHHTNLQVNICDLNGRKVQSVMVNKLQNSFRANLSNGTYIITFFENNKYLKSSKISIF
jgi:hypothetical protein